MPQQIMNVLNRKNPQQIIQNIEKKRFLNRILRFKKSNPSAILYFGGVAGLSLLYSGYLYTKRSQAQQQVEYRRSQLNKPVYELSGAQAYNVPWNSKNLNDWKHRQVTIRGRPIHGRASMIPTKLKGQDGFECVVPLVTSEKQDGSEQQGVLLSLGFIPQEHAHTSQRYKVESSDWQDFRAYVSTLDEYQDHCVFSGGNIGGFGDKNWSYADIQKMAQETGFVNWKNAQYAVLEQVRPNSTTDERTTQYRDMSSSYQQDYPYVQTIGGALQLPQMPWDYSNDAQFFTGIGGLFGGVAAALLFIA